MDDRGQQLLHARGLRRIDPRRDRSAPLAELAERRRDLLRRLARAEHELGHAGAQLAVMIDHRRADRVDDLGVRQVADLMRRGLRRDLAGAHFVEES